MNDVQKQQKWGQAVQRNTSQWRERAIKSLYHMSYYYCGTEFRWYPIKRSETEFFFWQYTCSIWILQGSCVPEFFLHSLLFCLYVNDRSSNEFSVRIWQLVHGTTLINGIYQPFRSFLLDEGSVILIAKECIDIKTRTPTLAFYDKEFNMKNILLVPKGLCPPPPYEAS